jgi:Na+/proline symporter/nitrogen-specific signal transduction histidine kinase
MNSIEVIAILLGYLLLIFAVAHWAEKRKNAKFSKNAVVYTLSIAVYCSAWTYYGSVGIAATSGLNYLPIYLGPVIAAPLWIMVLRKIIKISKVNNISSIADFISLRYGNSRIVGAIVTAVIIIGILPYLALQLKAISETFHLVTNTPMERGIFNDSSTYIALALAFFAAYYGTRYVDASQNRSGIVAAVALESVVKLVFFLVIGIFVTFFVFNGFGDISAKAATLENFDSFNTIGGIPQALNWLMLTVLSLLAIFMLPRQFQTMVIENTRERHLKTATWLFPLYLLIFNIFVFPIAWGGNWIFQNQNVNPDFYAILIPKALGHSWLEILVFLGGFSAAMSMIVISSISLSTMLSNNILIPYTALGRFSRKEQETNSKFIVNLRRLGIFVLIILAFLIYKLLISDYSLVSVGLIAFVIIAQLAPAFFGSLFWRRGSKRGMLCGLIVGFIICVYTVIIPYAAGDFSDPNNFINTGVFGQEWLRPFALFGLDYLDPIPHALFWSLLVNILIYFAVSVSFEGNYRERNYAEMYVDIDKFSASHENAFVWRGTAYRKDIEKVLTRFLGTERTARAMDIFNRKYQVDSNQELADSRLIKFSENLLTGRIGTASAKILISSVVKEEKITLTEVLKILEESKENIELNKKLTETSRELKSLSEQLKSANEELILKDKQKDEFLDTVTHELRTPITAIRASSEILLEDDALPEELKKQFLSNIIAESDRLNRLIDKILDLEKLESGKQKLKLAEHNFSNTLNLVLENLHQLIQNKGIMVSMNQPKDSVWRYDADRVTQVLTNMLSNAIKFCPEENGQIAIEVHENEDQLLVSVCDNGIGVHEHDTKRIFEKFYQSENQNLKKPIGSGLGLAICKNIVQLHGGKIWIENNENQGATITFTLPKINEL